MKGNRENMASPAPKAPLTRGSKKGKRGQGYGHSLQGWAITCRRTSNGEGETVLRHGLSQNLRRPRSLGKL
jgi:hypothetical protein